MYTVYRHVFAVQTWELLLHVAHPQIWRIMKPAGIKTTSLETLVFCIGSAKGGHMGIGKIWENMKPEI